jgi:hypothetical protein
MPVSETLKNGVDAQVRGDDKEKYALVNNLQSIGSNAGVDAVHALFSALGKITVESSLSDKDKRALGAYEEILASLEIAVNESEVTTPSRKQDCCGVVDGIRNVLQGHDDEIEKIALGEQEVGRAGGFVKGAVAQETSGS